MKLARKILLAAVLFGGGLAVGSWAITSNADGIVDPNQPGSVNDPIVTKSYVDEQVKTLVQAELANQQNIQDQDTKSSSSLVVVELNPGETLLADEGTEFIVRNGKAVVVSPNTNGVPDLTDGKDLRKDTLIPVNHLLLFPRDDGRGIKSHADEKGTIFVMVRGDYVHLDANGVVVQPVAP